MASYFLDKAHCSRHRIFPGVEIFTAAGQNLMLSLVEFEPGAVVEEHSHPHEQMGLLLEGEAEFTVAGETRLLRPGGMWRIPGGTPHSVVAGPHGARGLDVFHPIREDYL
jgi:quercetin dioxygenase-like cupin family protein